MPEEKKDSKPKKAVKKTAKAEKVKSPAKSTKKAKIKKEVVEVVETLANEVIDNQIEESPVNEPTADEFLKDFDWNLFEEGIETIKDDKLSEFEKLVEENFVDTYNESVIEGTIISLTEREAIIDINAKSEGVISLNEFRYNPDLKVGDKVEVLVDIQEDKTGQLVLSHRKARTIKAWDRVNDAHDQSTVVTGFVKCRTKGGMIVDVFGLEAFLPGSQIDVKPIRDYDQYVNKNMEFKVVKINHEFKNVVVSHKALIEADIELQKKEIIGQLEKGQVLEGTVKNITTYGVFIDLGGVDGLIHITDLSWNRINHPSEILELDQKLNVVILDFDDDKSRIQLGVKQLSAHPWESLDAELKEGDKVKGKVSVLADYGAFVEVVDGVEGLVHVSEMSWSTHLRSAQDFVKVGDEVEAIVLTLDREERKMSLGIKQLSSDPWTDITKKYPVGSKHSGIVRNFTNFGIFVELEEGIDGLVYISDLSWTVKVKHPSELFAAGDKIDVLVLELDSEARKLSLGHKQTMDNPWDVYDKTFAEGTSHNATISDSNDKGATIIFNDDITAFVPNRHLVKEDGNKLKKGDTSDFKVIEYNKDFKRVVMSHTVLFNDQEKKNVKESLKKVNVKDSDKSTLGDLDVLADLKKKMVDDEKKKK
ncbi:MAG: 30S ribosomal protein S1 [Flavobacteriaceae bacterium]|jgi:small subunit ribosomal protein S1|nr:30S ribosomal protein S1 [Flavobacteriaceae bacterium]MBT4960633.1 30S ribosomal protein S1 [Flavobacteriaceae bacterium]MBT5493832.1 30S ribosomal protein S1 [Flavobacteriaceae bacterium]MDA8558383.1 30S ribosomal protein S1 [Flavobacteriaceae bacterium]MDG1966988.1 30S ribosomal protein S1 [Flavobacteriaceae bacterium]